MDLTFLRFSAITWILWLLGWIREEETEDPVGHAFGATLRGRSRCIRLDLWTNTLLLLLLRISRRGRSHCRLSLSLVALVCSVSTSTLKNFMMRIVKNEMVILNIFQGLGLLSECSRRRFLGFHPRPCRHPCHRFQSSLVRHLRKSSSLAPAQSNRRRRILCLFLAIIQGNPQFTTRRHLQILTIF